MRLSKAREAEHFARVRAFMREPADEIQAELTAVREERDALVKAVTHLMSTWRQFCATDEDLAVMVALKKVEAAEKERE